ncbi:hypothetical protein [Actinoalloteichus caeruleus]|uniref:hypothetical protein n=1 Tax=Actinoalloteichus cyanogriseus TaxID=2893586 RepID=UPI003AAAF43A
MAANSPAEVLTTPEAEEVMPTWSEQVLGFTDWFSITHYIRMGCKELLGIDPVTELGEKIVGNWEEVGKAEAALNNLAEFHSAYADQLADLVPGLAWEGNAASAADDYFGRVAEALREQQTAIAEAAEAFGEFKRAIYFQLKALENIISALVDLVIELIFEALGGAAGLFTAGTTTAVAIAAAVYTISKALAKWAQAIEAIGLMITAVYALVGTVQGLTASLNLEETVPLPGAGYTHPGGS